MQDSMRFMTLVALLSMACGGEAEEPQADENTSGGESMSSESGGHHHHHHHGQGHHHDFSDVERFAEIFDAPDRDEWQKPDEVVAALALSEGQVVVDLGAGTGYFLRRLSQAVGSEGRVIGLDPEPAMVEHMRARIEQESLANAEASECPTDSPGLDPSSVDRILIVDTWHHISDREAYASKLGQTLREGGSILIVDFKLDAPQGPPTEMRLAPETIIGELQAGGLEAELVSSTLPHQYLIRASAP